MEKITIRKLNASTGEFYEVTLDVVYSQKPSAEDGFELVEWWEETETQYIQHWNVEELIASQKDFEEALSTLGVEM